MFGLLNAGQEGLEALSWPIWSEKVLHNTLAELEAVDQITLNFVVPDWAPP